MNLILLRQRHDRNPELYPGIVRVVGEFRDQVMIPFPYLEADCRIHGAASGGPIAEMGGRVSGVNCTEWETHPPGPGYGAQIRCLRDAFIDDAVLPGEKGARRVSFDELVRAGFIDIKDYVARTSDEPLSGSLVPLDGVLPTAAHPRN